MRFTWVLLQPASAAVSAMLLPAVRKAMTRAWTASDSHFDFLLFLHGFLEFGGLKFDLSGRQWRGFCEGEGEEQIVP
jgi:hypothetical protein